MLLAAVLPRKLRLHASDSADMRLSSSLGKGQADLSECREDVLGWLIQTLAGELSAPLEHVRRGGVLFAAKEGCCSSCFIAGSPDRRLRRLRLG